MGRFRPAALLLVSAALVSYPLRGQAQVRPDSPGISLSLADRLKEGFRPWEALLAQGENATVLKTVEGILAREALAVNRSNYNDMHALVAFHGLAARACVGEGAWEEGLEHLRKAQAVAAENLGHAETLFAKLRADHEVGIKASEEAIARQEPRLKELEEAVGLVEGQIKLKQQLRTFVDEHRVAIAQSRQTLKDVDAIQALLLKDREDFSKDSVAWTAFLAQEKEDIASRGGAANFVAEKVAQVKADDARPKAERLAYTQRLKRLDPANTDVTRLLNALQGKDEEPEKPVARKKAARKRRK